MKVADGGPEVGDGELGTVVVAEGVVEGVVERVGGGVTEGETVLVCRGGTLL